MSWCFLKQNQSIKVLHSETRGNRFLKDKAKISQAAAGKFKYQCGKAHSGFVDFNRRF
jgi:hypothetical protein